jgi:hypothetical protein
MRIVTTSFAIVVLAAACAARPAAANPPQPAQPASPLDALVGSWEGGGTFAFVKDGKTLPNPHGVMRCDRAAAGAAVVCTVAITADGGFRLEEQEIYGYDRASDTYHVFTANNFGEAYDHAGRFDGRVGTFHYRTPREGKTFHEEYKLEWRSASELLMYGTDDVDGDVVVRGVMTVRKTS